MKIGMDGKGRYSDSILSERLRWMVKYEDVYPEAYFRFYNEFGSH